MLTSSDYANTFTKRNSGTTVRLYDIAYGSSTFVTVGAEGTIISSPDGIIGMGKKVL